MPPSHPSMGSAGNTKNYQRLPNASHMTIVGRPAGPTGWPTHVMKRLNFKLVAAVFVLSGCMEEGTYDEETGSLAAPIVNGTITTGDPAVVYVSGGCTGTLISPKVVLTARHCTYTGASKKIFFGSKTNSQGQWIYSQDVKVYTPGSGIGSGDLAVILLKEKGPTTPIPVSDRDLKQYIGSPMRMVGFGKTSTNGGGSGTKREGMTKLQKLNSSGTVMYSGGDPSGHCFGDSGGPKFMEFDSKEWVVGVTSFVQNGCGNYGRDGSASTHTHYKWIMDYVDKNDPASCDQDERCAENCNQPDPDCPCVADGFCSLACTDWLDDPDCAGCEMDGVCREDCPVLDEDCCEANGVCYEACGDLDPDCIEEPDPDPPPPNDPQPPPPGDESPLPPNDANPGDPQAQERDPYENSALRGVVACSLTRTPCPVPKPSWLWLVFALAFARRLRSQVQRQLAHSDKS
jgi:hypothetical protein